MVEGLIRVPRSPRWLTGLFLNDGVAVPLIDLTAWAQSDGGGAGAGATKGRRRALRFGAVECASLTWYDRGPVRLRGGRIDVCLFWR